MCVVSVSQIPLPSSCPVLLDIIFRKPQAALQAVQRPAAAAAAAGMAVAGVQPSDCHTCDSDKEGAVSDESPAGGDAAVGSGGGCDVRNVLHVQSISSWAPSCIGPYSQVGRCRAGGGGGGQVGRGGIEGGGMGGRPGVEGGHLRWGGRGDQGERGGIFKVGEGGREGCRCR